MIVFSKVDPLIAFLSERRKKGDSIGFIPTMGALHMGHISLLERSQTENDLCVCSIYVNPRQFNDKEDLEKYPRTIEEDKLLLEKSRCDVLFVPVTAEIYPAVEDSNYLKVNLGNLGNVMEGEKRPGHFAGVVQVVSRLFDIIKPNRAYFGQKDYQQQAIIREMCRQLEYPVEIITCPIVREYDGLAMSSRNKRLSDPERKEAALISQVLFNVKKLAGKTSFVEINSMVAQQIAASAILTLDYFSIVNGLSLQPVDNMEDAPGIVACIAVNAGQVRLIDNVILK